MTVSTAGIAAIGDYATPATDALKVAALKALIPNPELATGSSGAVAGGGFLDEMSPAAAIQLLVELAALQAAVAQT